MGQQCAVPVHDCGAGGAGMRPGDRRRRPCGAHLQDVCPVSGKIIICLGKNIRILTKVLKKTVFVSYK